MTTLTSVKYITQQELLDVLPRTMYGEKGNAAPGPQLGHTMPVGLPFWLGVNNPFNLRKKDMVEFLFIYFCLIKAYLTAQWFNTSPQWGNEPLPVHVRDLMCTADYTRRKRLKWGLAVPPWGCGWISCVWRHPGAHPNGLSFGVLWTVEERSAPAFCRLYVGSLCCGVQRTLRKHQWIRHRRPSRDRAGWPLLTLQWPKAWTLLLSIPCPTQPLGIYDLKFIGNHTLAWQLQKQWLALSGF